MKPQQYGTPAGNAHDRRKHERACKRFRRVLDYDGVDPTPAVRRWHRRALGYPVIVRVVSDAEQAQAAKELDEMGWL